MKLRLFAVVAMLVFASVAWAQPQITNVTGTIEPGMVVTLEGRLFGAKDNPAPLKFDDFEDGSIGSDLRGWEFSTSDDRNPQYSGEYRRNNSDLAAVCLFDQGQYLSAFGVYREAGLTSVYMDFWVLFSAETRESRNHKLYRLYAGYNQGRPNQYLQLQCSAATPVGRFTNDYVNGTWDDTHDITIFRPDEADERWVHMQFYLNQSDAGVANGILQSWFNGAPSEDRTNYLTRDTTYTLDWQSLWFGNYVAHESDSNCGSISDAFVFFDNVYIDTTPARVEIGDSSDYNSCVHREIQIPVNWSAEEITLSANPGAFPVGSEVWVFVVDENRRISGGFGPIDITGGSVVDGPSQPGTPELSG